MTEEIEGYQEDLRYLVETLSDGLKNLPTTKQTRRHHIIAGLEQTLASAKAAYASFNTCYRELDSALQPKYHPIGVEYRDQLTTITTALKSEKIANERERHHLTEAQLTTDELLQEAVLLQQQSKESTQASKKVISEITETGMATNEQLQKDRAKLDEVELELGELQSDLDMASRQLKSILRKLSKDRIIRGLCIIAGLIVLTALIVVIVRRDEAGGGTDTT